MKVNIMNYEYLKKELDIDVSDVHHIDVEVYAGDEILTIVKNNYESIKYDSAVIFDNPRCLHGFNMEDVFDGDYTVGGADIEKWLEREDTYEWIYGYSDESEDEYMNS